MSRSARVYRRMLRLYSRVLTREYGDDMVAAFEAMVAQELLAGRRFAVLRVWRRVTVDLLLTVPVDRFRAAPVHLGLRPRQPPGRITVESRLQDVRFALRVLRRQPLFTLVASLTVAIGVGATATIFSFANGLLFRTPAGVTAGSELVSIHRKADDGSGFHAFSIPMFRHLAASDAGVSLASYDSFGGGLVIDGASWPIGGLVVSAGYFDVLGTRPLRGRFFHADEDAVPGRDPVAVISERLWRERFGSDPDVIGREVQLNGRGFVIVGVAEEGFQGHLAVFRNHVWVPLSAQGLIRGDTDLSEERASIGLELIGRLDNGVSAELARDGLDRAAATFTSERGERWDGLDLLDYAPVVPVAQQGVNVFLAALFGIAGLLLTITSVNVANMLLSRGAARSREVGIRLALGATRARLITQLLTESVALFLLGGAMSLLLAVWLTRLLAGFELPVPLPIELDFHPDLNVLVFALAVAAVTGVVFGLSPAFHATGGDLHSALKQGPASSRRRQRLRGALVVTQVAGCAVLLVVAGLLIRVMGRAAAAELGLDPEGVISFALDARVANLSDEDTARFFTEVLESARNTPGVQRAALIDIPPLTGSNQQTTIVLPDRPREPDRGLQRVELARVSPDYFSTMAIPLLEGRDFNAADTRDVGRAVVVNETFARRLFPGESLVGQHFGLGSIEEPIDVEIVGMARDSKIRSPFDPDRMLVYVSWEQFSAPSLTLMTRVGDSASGALLRDRIRELQPGLPPADPVPFTRLMGLSMLPAQVVATLATAFGATGILLAAIGLYGLLAYSVVQRSAEMGVRIALGAERWQVRRLIVRDGLRLAGIGLILGLVLAAGLARLLRSLLFGVNPLDPMTYGGIAAILLAVAAVACWIPAGRAAGTDPVVALRCE